MQNDEFNSQNEYNQDLEIELGATPSSLKDLEVTENVDFSYDGYQVVRGEYFVHLFEPSVTFNKCKVYLNTACIKKFPEIDYVQILVNSEEKKLAVRPCSEEEKILLCGVQKKEKLYASQITK